MTYTGLLLLTKLKGHKSNVRYSGFPNYLQTKSRLHISICQSKLKDECLPLDTLYMSMENLHMNIINILLQTTKGRNWTVDEKEKAMKFKKMCSHRCYNFVRKNLVPLPCTWELNSSDNAKKNRQGKAEISTAVTEGEAKKIVIWQEDLKSAEMIEVQNIDEENQVIIVPPDLWTSNQKIEFIVNEITEVNEISQVSGAECQEDMNSQRT